jgi:hypothetical protein
MDFADWTTLDVLLGIAVPAALLSAFAAFQERRQRRRHNLDRISPINWSLLSILSLILAVACGATALHLK